MAKTLKTTKGMRVATAWKLCIEMWDARIDNDIHKSEWCLNNGYKLKNDCFFCDYALRQEKKVSGPITFNYGVTCQYCPARAVEPDFICESGRPWEWWRFPLKFHAKLHCMNKKRLAMRKTT